MMNFFNTFMKQFFHFLLVTFCDILIPKESKELKFSLINLLKIKIICIKSSFIIFF